MCRDSKHTTSPTVIRWRKNLTVRHSLTYLNSAELNNNGEGCKSSCSWSPVPQRQHGESWIRSPYSYVWRVGFTFPGCSPFCLRPQHISSYIKCSCHCHIMQLQGVSPTPARASEKAVLALHGNLETEALLGSNSEVAFGKQIIHVTLKVQQLLPTWNTEFHKMWLCCESKTAVKYTQFKQLHKALKSEITKQVRYWQVY